MIARAEIVEKLVEAALTGIEFSGVDATSGELMSACFTIALRAIKACMVHPENQQEVRKAVERLLMECVPAAGRPN